MLIRHVKITFEHDEKSFGFRTPRAGISMIIDERTLMNIRTHTGA